MTTPAAIFVALFGLLIVTTCLYSFFNPQWLFDFARPRLEQPWLMPLAVIIRLALAAALLIVAEDSSFPLAFTILGWFTLIAAITLPFIGQARIKSLVNWFESRPRSLVRAWVLVGAALGALFLAGVYPLFG